MLFLLEKHNVVGVLEDGENRYCGVLGEAHGLPKRSLHHRRG
jgi:hypothetical protein